MILHQAGVAGMRHAMLSTIKRKKSLPKSRKKGETGSRVLLSLKSSCGVSQALGTADTNSLSHAVLELDRS